MQRLPHKIKDLKTGTESFVRGSFPHGVPFNQRGFPDFTRYAEATVKIKLTGNTKRDFDLANQAMGWTKTPKGYTWHHHQEEGVMQLIDLSLHKKVGHTGGIGLSKHKK